MDKLHRQTRKSLLHLDRYDFICELLIQEENLTWLIPAAEPVKINGQELGSDGFKREEVESGGK